MKVRHGSGGFTLTELLVVVVAIAILAGLLLPALNTVRERKRRAQCATNLQQIGAGLLAYARDHDMHLPTAVNNKAGTWDAALGNGYLQDPRTFLCPSDRLDRGAQLARSYSISESRTHNNRYWVQGSRIPCRYLPNPAEIVLVAELVEEGNVLGANNYSSIAKETHVRSMHVSLAATGAQPAANYLFLDGHVAWSAVASSNWFPAPPPQSAWPWCP